MHGNPHGGRKVSCPFLRMELRIALYLRSLRGNAGQAVDGSVKGTETLIGWSAGVETDPRFVDPLKRLLDWVQSNQKSSPYIRTCEASPPTN